MDSFIERIRNKPPHERDKIIKYSAGALIIFLLIVWIIVGNGKKSGQHSNFIQNFKEKVKGTQNNLKNTQK